MRRAYLDHAATAPMPAKVREEFARALELVGNPASTHQHGQEAAAHLETAREEIAAALGADRAEVIFTAGGTESVNLALKGIFWARRKAGRGNIILLPDGEHHATIEACEWLSDSQGARLVHVPVDAAGRVQPQVLRDVLIASGPENVALFTCLWANNEVGTVQPVRQLCEVAASFGVPTHLDAVAALGQVPVRLHESGAAAVSVSAHKIGGPAGVGALLLGRHTQCEALLHGGTQQRARSGSQNVAGAVGFAAALNLAVSQLTGEPLPERLERMLEIRRRIIAGVREIAPDAVLRGDADQADAGETRIAGNVNFTFPGCQGDSLVYLLDMAGVSVSQGSACQAGVAEISHVLLALGLSPQEAAGSLRFTFGPETADWEVAALLAALPGALARAQQAGFSGVE